MRTRRPGAPVSVLLARYRRIVVAVLVAVAGGLAVDAATAAPPAGDPVATVARDLPAGHVLQAADVTETELPSAAVPHGVLTTAAAVGEVLAAPVRSGEVLTDARLLTSVTARLPPGRVALPVRLTDAGVLTWVRPGQRVGLLAGAGSQQLDPLTGEAVAGRSELVARDVIVIDVPRAPPESALGGGPAAEPLLLVAVTEEQARDVAGISAGGWLTVALMA